MSPVFESIEDVETFFENSPTKIVITREAPELSSWRVKLGQVKPGQEIELPYWAATELARAGIGKFKDDDPASLANLSKIHWRETIPGSKQIPSLSATFYCLLRRSLRGLWEESRKDPSRLKDYEKALSLSTDIVNCRVKKVVSLAAGETPPEQMLQGLTLEEQALYRSLNRIIDGWRSKVLTAQVNAP